MAGKWWPGWVSESSLCGGFEYGDYEGSVQRGDGGWSKVGGLELVENVLLEINISIIS